MADTCSAAAAAALSELLPAAGVLDGTHTALRAMSVAFNSGPSGPPLVRMIAAFVASRAGRPPSGSRRHGGGDGGTRDRGIRAAAMSSLPYGLWRDRGDALDITSAQNPKVKLMRFVCALGCVCCCRCAALLSQKTAVEGVMF